jgi:lipopolysaccharide export system protein LptC
MRASMQKRTAHRWRLMSIMAVGIFFALGSFWLLQVMQQNGDNAQSDADKNEPDYIVENFSFVRMSPTGKPRYIISGTKLTHRPIDDTSDIDKPVVKSLNVEHPPMTMNALRARVRHSENEIDLLGKVDIERPATPTSKRLMLKTEALTLYTDEERMSSDQLVEMMLGNSTIRGVGMQADNAAQKVHFSSQGQIVYPPNNSR